MDEYIRRSEAEQHLVGRLLETALNNTSINIEACQVYSDAADRLRDCWIKEIPAADVKPVVRGKWETVRLDHERIGCRPTAHYCSKCHQITWFITFYCHNCGADMRGGDAE